MHVRPAIVLVVITLFSLGCFAQMQPVDGNPIKAADIAFAQATKEHGLAGWMSFFADNAYVGSKPSVQGKEELRKYYQGLFDHRDLKFEWAPEHAEVFGSGVMGYSSGRYTMTYSNAQGASVARSGNYVTIWQKQSDGTWKVFADFGSQDKANATATTTGSAAKPAGQNQ